MRLKERVKRLEDKNKRKEVIERNKNIKSVIETDEEDAFVFTNKNRRPYARDKLADLSLNHIDSDGCENFTTVSLTKKQVKKLIKRLQKVEKQLIN